MLCRRTLSKRRRMQRQRIAICRHTCRIELAAAYRGLSWVVRATGSPLLATAHPSDRLFCLALAPVEAVGVGDTDGMPVTRSGCAGGVRMHSGAGESSRPSLCQFQRRPQVRLMLRPLLQQLGGLRARHPIQVISMRRRYKESEQSNLHLRKVAIWRERLRDTAARIIASSKNKSKYRQSYAPNLNDAVALTIQQLRVGHEPRKREQQYLTRRLRLVRVEPSANEPPLEQVEPHQLDANACSPKPQSYHFTVSTQVEASDIRWRSTSRRSTSRRSPEFWRAISSASTSPPTSTNSTKSYRTFHSSRYSR